MSLYKQESSLSVPVITGLQFQEIGKNDRDVDSHEKEDKSERGMPRLSEARKDAVSCEKLRGSANRT